MAPIPLKYVVSFSSQDPKNPVENLQKGDGTKRWLSAANDKTGQLEAIFQLEKSTAITNIDIGTFWVFSIQVKVGQSVWPASREYETLLPATTCMTPNDCRFGKNKAAMKLFKQADFDKDTQQKAWDRVKVVCSQPFRKDAQFGLSVLRIVGGDTERTDSRGLSRGVTPNKTFGSGFPRTPQAQKQQCDDIFSPKSAADIEKHFFGKMSSKDKVTEDLRSKLSRIGASSEHGTEKEASLSRNVKLIMAAADKLPRYKVPGTPLNGIADSDRVNTVAVSSPIASINKKKRKQSFDEEVDDFFCKLDVASLDLDNLTFADLRHRLEKLKFRKLTKEEKKTFFKKAQKFVEKITEEEEENNSNNAATSANKTKVKPRSSTSPGSEVSPTGRTLTIAMPSSNSLKSKKEKGETSSKGQANENSVKDKKSPSRPIPDFGKLGCVSVPRFGPQSPMGPTSLDNLPATDSKRKPSFTESNGVHNGLPAGKLKFVKSDLKMNFPASEPRPSKPKKKRAKKNGVLPTGSNLSQQILTLFDEDSDSPSSPVEEIEVWNKTSTKSASRKRKRTKQKPKTPDTNNVWLSSKSFTEPVGKLQNSLTTSRKKTGRKTGNAPIPFSLEDEADDPSHWKCPSCKENIPTKNRRLHEATCNMLMEILSSGSDVEVLPVEKPSSATPGRRTATPVRSIQSNKKSNGYKDDIYQNSGGFLTSSHQSNSSSGYSSEAHTYSAIDSSINKLATEEGECPLCYQMFPFAVLQHHADSCASLQETVA